MRLGRAKAHDCVAAHNSVEQLRCNAMKKKNRACLREEARYGALAAAHNRVEQLRAYIYVYIRYVYMYMCIEEGVEEGAPWTEMKLASDAASCATAKLKAVLPACVSIRQHTSA